jgi:hypothetical protein
MYGMGDGVAQDYRAAFHWFFFGDASQQGLSAEDELARGYAETVSYYARSKITGYPGKTPANVDVIFKVATGEVSFQAHGVPNDHSMDHIFRGAPFTDVIADGYAEAIKVVPRPPELAASTLEFVVPWMFRTQ